MARKYGFLLLAGLIAGLMISGRYAILAQDRAVVPPTDFTRRSARKLGCNEDGFAGEKRWYRQAACTSQRVVQESANVVSLQRRAVAAVSIPVFAPDAAANGVRSFARDT